MWFDRLHVRVVESNHVSSRMYFCVSRLLRKSIRSDMGNNSSRELEKSKSTVTVGTQTTSTKDDVVVTRRNALIKELKGKREREVDMLVKDLEIERYANKQVCSDWWETNDSEWQSKDSERKQLQYIREVREESRLMILKEGLDLRKKSEQE